MRNGYKITLGILTVMILLTIAVGTSYSYYSVSGIQEDENILNTTCFSVTYEDVSSSINLQKTYPMTDTAGLALNPYTFRITNTCEAGNANTKYVVTLNTLTTPATTINTSYLKYSLDKDSVKGAATAFPTTKYELNPNIKTTEDIENSYQIAVGELAPGASATYDLRLWIDNIDVNCTIAEDGTQTCDKDIMGKSFTGKILVYNYM